MSSPGTPRRPGSHKDERQHPTSTDTLPPDHAVARTGHGQACAGYSLLPSGWRGASRISRCSGQAVHLLALRPRPDQMVRDRRLRRHENPRRLVAGQDRQHFGTLEPAAILELGAVKMDVLVERFPKT